MKRTLALVLALVMAIGLMAFPVSADFKDDAEIKYTEAVDVMSAMGVINGFEDGSFDPDGYLTREQAAKVVAYLMLGAEQADAMSAGSAPFDDVAANRWSAGYIAYCVNEGIINGRTETTFDPTGNVTGYEFAKLMLGCLGYDGSIEQYTGSTWNINVAKTALTIGLFDGNKGANYNVALTREEAALYAFNMLQADLVDYDNRGTVIELPGGGSISTGASKAAAIEDADDKTDGTIDKDGYVQFAERYFEDLVKTPTDDDDFGRPAVKWTYDKDEVGTYADKPEVTYTTATKGSTIYSDLSKPSDADFTYIVDGKTINDMASLIEDFDIAAGNDKKIGGNGALVEVYEDPKNDGDYIVTVVNTFVAELSAWNEADEDKDKEESVTLSTITEPNTYYENLKSSFRATLNTTFETTKFTEDDADDELVVIYTAAMNDDDGKYDIKSVDVAKSVTAFITATSGETSFTAGGETYKYSAVHSGQAAYNKDADDAVFYLDSYGYVVYIDMDAAESTDYAYVEAVESDRGMFEEEVYYAKMVLANGETVIAPVDKAYTWDDGEDAYKEYTISSDDDAVMSNSIVSYTVNKDGEYKLYVQTSGADLVDDGNLAITKGNAAIKDSTTITNANDKTVFIVGETDGSKVEYEVYTGIRNVPSISGGDYTFYENAAGAAKVVVVIDPTNTSSSSSESIYVAYDDAADKIINADYEDGYYELNAVVNGEITTVKLDVATYEAMTEDVYVKSVSTDRDGLIDGFGSDVKTAEGKSAKIEDGMVKVGNDYYTVADDCNVYTVEDAEITSSSLNSVKTNSDIVVSFNDDDMVNVIYIIIAD